MKFSLRSLRPFSTRALPIWVIVCILAWQGIEQYRQKPKSISLSSIEQPVQNGKVCFTPGEACTDAIVSTLARSQKSIFVQAYSFTSAPIAKALVDAHKRGVQVRVILDKSQRGEKYSSSEFLRRQGVAVKIDSEHAIAHNKVIIIDEKVLITGSFNFTKAAQERNAENLLILHHPELASLYLKNWKKHEEHSE